tara:strand:- start:49 stop:750 length:702 start_codon:yes stop_codon:yes gene_type:complete
MVQTESALIVGAGRGLSASLTRLFTTENMKVSVAARNTEKLAGLCEETGAKAYTCDATNPDQVKNLFAEVIEHNGKPNIVVYNASNRARGPIQELDVQDVKKAIDVSCFGGFLVAQAAAKEMVPRGSGTILFTGASASVKGYPNSSSFAMGKFGLRGLAQSLARELQPQNIHVAHFVIDGGITIGVDDPRQQERGKDTMLLPDEIAKEYLHVHRQHRSSWNWEVELRPWVEKF